MTSTGVSVIMSQQHQHRQVHVVFLGIYLRNYLSIYYTGGTNYHQKSHGRDAVDVKLLIRYWTFVEKGRSAGSESWSPTSPKDKKRRMAKKNTKDDHHDTSIAAKLEWPRTRLDIGPADFSNFSQEENGQRFLPYFQGHVHLVPLNGHIGNDVFPRLANVMHLDMSFCSIYKTINDDVFRHLINLRSLNMSKCNQETITDDAFVHFTNLTSLNMSECNQETITDEAFRHLTNLQLLNMSFCSQETITNDAFRHLTNMSSLDIKCCRQETITNDVFRYLRNLEWLNMGYCTQLTITDEAFQDMTNLLSLVLPERNQLRMSYYTGYDTGTF